ncbi:hypothetical protein D9615_007791 [Tricholomella constricta]|uniref:Uncharacterized protein n=1 Tax=Tricholomella constricta TaxID=117010 RepID=A0A8H5M119_9AGAR|nr:hypothetical protein D9615_007791 [Tricholomella constricta]
MTRLDTDCHKRIVNGPSARVPSISSANIFKKVQIIASFFAAPLDPRGLKPLHLSTRRLRRLCKPSTIHTRKADADTERILKDRGLKL